MAQQRRFPHQTVVQMNALVSLLLLLLLQLLLLLLAVERHRKGVVLGVHRAIDQNGEAAWHCCALR